MLGVSYNTVVNWENAGRLHAHKQMRLLTNGQHREIRVYKEAEVRQFLRRRDPNEDGEVAARAFEMFQEGRPIREIVIALKGYCGWVQTAVVWLVQLRPSAVPAPRGTPGSRTSPRGTSRRP